MRQLGIRAVRIVKGDLVFHVHGDQAGAEGVYLSKGQVHGLYDAPVKTTYKSGAFQEGSTYRHTKRLHRDLELGFLIKETASSYELNDSVFRQMFEYEPDRWDESPSPTTIEVETDLSGLRKLDVLMYEAPEFVPDLDPLADEFGNAVFKLRAADPDWYEDMQVSSFGGETSDGDGFVTVENPTDKTMYHKWVLTPANWILPDYSWVGAKGERVPGGDDGTRTLSGINITVGNGGAVIDLDRSELMFRDANNTNIQAQLGSTKIFIHPIPPYTPATDLPVAYSDGPGMAQIRMFRRWSRPWGLEQPSAVTLSGGTPRLVTFTRNWTYKIPTWADTIDLIGIGDGGGGEGGTILPGPCGGPGEWQGITLHRGSDIDWADDTLSGTIGTGGIRGRFLPTEAATAGVGTKFFIAGTDTELLSCDGGQPGVGIPGFPLTSQSPPVEDFEFNGRTFHGGYGPVFGWTPWALPGPPPGGGGAGGIQFGPGGNGARGQAWIIAYQSGC